MSELYKTLASWSSDTISGTQAIESIQDIWELMRAEDYASERGRLAADATVVAASHSEFVYTHSGIDQLLMIF